MNIENLYEDVAEYHELGHIVYAEALQVLADNYENMGRDEYYKLQEAHNERWVDYPKINL